MLNFSQNISRIISASTLILAFSGISLQDVQAASAGNQITVRVNLQNGISQQNGDSDLQHNSAFCRSNDLPGAFGATVTVVCATGTVVDISANNHGAVHGGAYRHLLHAPAIGIIRGTVDGYIGVGTVLSWRQIKLNDLDYLEMLVGW